MLCVKAVNLGKSSGVRGCVCGGVHAFKVQKWYSSGVICGGKQINKYQWPV